MPAIINFMFRRCISFLPPHLSGEKIVLSVFLSRDTFIANEIVIDMWLSLQTDFLYIFDFYELKNYADVFGQNCLFQGHHSKLCITQEY